MAEMLTIAGKKYQKQGEEYIPTLKETPFEKEGGTYRLEMVDQHEMMIPNIQMPIKLDLGKLNSFGRARLKFLKDNKENSYQIMMMEERLMDHLIDIENQVEEFLRQEEGKMMESWGLTLEMKSQDLEKYLKLKKNMDMELQEIAMKEIVLV